jgi:hypothetical protein
MISDTALSAAPAYISFTALSTDAGGCADGCDCGCPDVGYGWYMNFLPLWTGLAVCSSHRHIAPRR